MTAGLFMGAVAGALLIAVVLFDVRYAEHRNRPRPVVAIYVVLLLGFVYAAAAAGREVFGWSW